MPEIWSKGQIMSFKNGDQMLCKLKAEESQNILGLTHFFIVMLHPLMSWSDYNPDNGCALYCSIFMSTLICYLIDFFIIILRF